MSQVKVLAFAGSSRTGSFNKKLIAIAAEGVKKAGAEVNLLDLRDYPLPHYDGDLEAQKGIPENAKKLRQLFVDHDGIAISSPEYNSSLSGLLKNTIDWISRPDGDVPPLVAFKGKAAVLMAASPGGLGGLRGLVHLRAILGNIGVIVLPQQVAIPKAGDAFNDDGNLKDAKKQEEVLGLGKFLTEFLVKHRREAQLS